MRALIFKNQGSSPHALSLKRSWWPVFLFFFRICDTSNWLSNCSNNLKKTLSTWTFLRESIFPRWPRREIWAPRGLSARRRLDCEQALLSRMGRRESRKKEDTNMHVPPSAKSISANFFSVLPAARARSQARGRMHDTWDCWQSKGPRPYYFLKCHCNENLDIHIFTFSVFARFLAKFQSVTNVRTRGFWTFISKNLRPPLIFLSLAWKLEKMTPYSQKYHTG